MVLQSRQDSAQFAEGHIDNAIKAKAEGGYTSTRPRYTRNMLKEFHTGFSDLTEAEKNIFEAFVEDHGTFLIFEWIHPTTAIQYSVRFDNVPQIKYIGRGTFRFWSSTGIVLKEV